MILKRDDAFQVVFSLRTPLRTGQISVGTGIFVKKSESEIYLVTASHVAQNCGPDTSVIVCDQVGNPAAIPLQTFSNGRLWRHHREADISVLQIDPSETVMQHVNNRSFPLDHFHLDPIPVSRDCELTSVGFPYGLGIDGMFCPLTFRSFASSSFITLPRADTKVPSVFFLLEDPSIGGYSGCPVFDLGYVVVGTMVTTKDKTRCFGIMHGTTTDPQGGSLALVTPAFYLRDLL